MKIEDISTKKEKKQKIYRYYGSKINLAGSIFLIGAILGVIWMCYIINNKDMLQLIEVLKKEDFIQNVPTFKSIFMTNIVVAFIMCIGAIAGRFIPQIIILINGFMLGTVVSSYFYTNISKMVLLSLLPHSIIEVFLLLFCASFGMKKYIKYSWQEYLKLFIFIIIGFAIAACIEVNVSYRMAQYFQ